MAEVRLDLLGEINLPNLKQVSSTLKEMNEDATSFKRTSSSTFDGLKSGATGAEKTLSSYLKATEDLIDKEKALKKALEQVEKQISETTDPAETRKLQKAFNLLEKDAQNLDKTLNGAKDSIKKIGDSGSKFSGLGREITTNVIAPLLAFSTIKDVFNSTVETIETAIKRQGEAARLTDLQGSALDSFVSKAAAVAETFDQDYNEVIRSANTLAKEFDISQTEALKKIEDGFLSGADASGDFLDTVKEYPAQFAQLGGDVDNFINVLVKGQQEGIFSDKGIDAVKEFGLRIREQSQATADAVTQLLGADRADELLGGIKDGSVSQIEALKEISGELNNTEIDSSTLQKAVADIFGSAGEDAGLRYLQTLKDIDSGTEDLIDTTDAYTRLQREQLENAEKIAQSEQELAASFEDYGDVFDRVSTDISVGWNRLVQATNEALSGQQSFYEVIQNFRAIDNPLVRYEQQLERIKEKSDEAFKSTGLSDELRTEYNQLATSAIQLVDQLNTTAEDRETTVGEFGKLLQKDNAQLEAEIQETRKQLEALGTTEETINKIFRNLNVEPQDVKEPNIKIVPDQKELDRQSRAAQVARDKELKSQEAFFGKLEALELKQRKESINSLEAGSQERILAESELQSDLLAVYEQDLNDQLSALNLNGEALRVAQSRISKTVSQLEIDIFNDTSKKISDLKQKEADKLETESQAEIDLARDLEFAQAEGILNARRSSFDSEEEFENFKAQELRKVKLNFYQQDLALLGDNLDAEGELLKQKLTNNIDDLNAEIEQNVPTEEESTGFSLAGLLGLTDDQFSILGEGVSQFANAADQILAVQAETNQAIIDSYDDRISAQEELVEAERSLSEEGKANNLRVEQQRLNELKSQREAAAKEQEKIQKRQAQLDLATQASSIITAVANTFAANSGIPFGAGLILSLGYVASMIAAFKSYKAQTQAAVSLEKGGSGDYFGMVTGRSHAQGGERFTDHIEVQSGENFGVLNRTASNKYGGMFHEFVKLANLGVNPMTGMTKFEEDQEFFRNLNPGFNPIIEAKQIREMNINLANDNSEMVKEIQGLRDQIDALTSVVESRPHYMSFKEGDTIRKVSKGTTIDTFKK